MRVTEPGIISTDRQAVQGKNETCPGETPAAPNLGGISLWDVIDPRHPKPVALRSGDFTAPNGTLEASPNQTHSMDESGRKYVLASDRDFGLYVPLQRITDRRAGGRVVCRNLVGPLRSEPKGADQVPAIR